MSFRYVVVTNGLGFYCRLAAEKDCFCLSKDSRFKVLYFIYSNFSGFRVLLLVIWLDSKIPDIALAPDACAL